MGGTNGSFAALLGLIQLLYIAGMMTLGVRLLRVAVQNRKLPETLLASHFILCLGFGYVLLIVALAAARQPGALPPALVTGMVGTGQLLSCLGVFAGVSFNFLVFRKNEIWARALLTGIAMALAVGWTGYGLSGGFSHGLFEGLWFWLFYGAYIVSAVWVMIEPLRYYTTMRRRQRLGLADPVLVNRFLLWGLGSVCRVIMVSGGVVPALVFDAQVQNITPGVFGFSILAIALVGLTVAACYWLAFFPTQGYLAFVRRRAGVTPAPEAG